MKKLQFLLVQTGANAYLAKHPKIKTDFKGAVCDLKEKHISRKLLAGVSREAKSFIWSVLALRKFNTASLRKITGGLIAGDLDYFNNKAEGDYLDIIKAMIDGGVASWNGDTGGYVIDDSLRSLMMGVLKTTEPKTVRSQHQIADELYSEWVKRYPENSGNYLNEVLYHNGELLKEGWTTEEDVRAKVNRLLQEIPQGGIDKFRELTEEDKNLTERFSPNFLSWLQIETARLEEEKKVK